MRPAAYYELLKSKIMNNQVGYILTKQVLGYWQCSPTRMPQS